ncbi:hypothetical protein JKP88DRAFT_255965 [Tribonema minus]|uniref:Uncharacterized protein n=1 Tax=Tribonema minus TaxID=303371 RepID=A0A836CEL5_9STRA|nr:hypothetical protein JKP88DRAFT_255965 [Tribonema minus]
MSNTAALSKLVNWGNAIVVERHTPKNEEAQKMWFETCAPEASSQLIGNKDSIKAINAWFKGVQYRKCWSLWVRQGQARRLQFGCWHMKTVWTFTLRGQMCRERRHSWPASSTTLVPFNSSRSSPFLCKCASRKGKSISEGDATVIAQRNPGDARKMLLDMQMSATTAPTKRKRDTPDNAIAVTLDTTQESDSIDSASPVQWLESLNHWLKQCRGVDLETMASIASDMSHLDAVVGMYAEAQAANEDTVDLESLDMQQYFVSDILKQLQRTKPSLASSSLTEIMASYGHMKAPRVNRKFKYVH